MMVAQEIIINCAECLKDNHGMCTKENCLCRLNKHGIKPESISDEIVKAALDSRYASPPKEPRDYEQAQRDAQRLELFEDEGLCNNSPSFALIEYCKLLILVRHVVSKFELVTIMKTWYMKYCCGFSQKADMDEIDSAIETVFKEPDVFDCIKKISKCLGSKNIIKIFDKTQLIEVGEWIKGRHFIKRIELTGDLLFFNEEYYERDAEAHIRRESRKLITRSKNADVNEVVKYVEDTCDLITWRDIESSIHLKCLLNGIYDIKSGIFSSKFNPDFIILNQIPHSYNESSTFTNINEKVTTLIPNEKSRQSYYDFISTCLHPYTGIDYQFGMVGGTGTGKSQLGILSTLTLGEDNVGDATIHLIAKDQTTQKNMAFKMVNIDYDLNPESIKQLDVIKKWITQDKFTARGIYEQATTFRPMSRLMFMANDLYEISNPDDAEAIYDRTYIIRVDKKFRHQSEEIKRVMEKTASTEQLSGFITYLLKNAHEIYENESYHYPIAPKDVENIWNTFGNRIKMFIKKWVDLDTTNKTESGDPYNKWMNHCFKNNWKTKDKKNFTKLFDEIIGNTAIKTRNGEDQIYAYVGLRIKTEEEVAKEETGIVVSDTINLLNKTNNEYSGIDKSSKSSMNLIPLDIFKKINKSLENEKKDGAFGASSHERKFESDDD